MSTERIIQKHPLVLTGTAVFAFLWVVARACVQSITIDEADTYLAYVLRAGPSHWEAGSNNHVLNSALARLFTMVFGANAFTLRVPALLGAALYIASVYCLARLISQRPVFRWSFFVCLVYSPFLMDYLVAARGYSLAAGFLMCALALAGHHQTLDEAARAARLQRTAAWISVCLSLSVCANFAFGIIDVAGGNAAGVLAAAQPAGWFAQGPGLFYGAGFFWWHIFWLPMPC